MLHWNKLGLIFNPADHKLADDCTDFAKSPQAVDMGDFIRVYFTSQKKTENGKWISCPQFVDFTTDFAKILNVSSSPLLEQGGLGQFDEHGIFPFNVLRHDSKIVGYTSGWSRRKSVSVDMAIGRVESHDGGATFVRDGRGGPVLAKSVHEPHMIADAFVRHYEGAFHMWYIFGTEWADYGGSEPERTYKIAHAVSQDGKEWVRGSRPIINDVIGNECQALPSVCEWDGLYHMVFCYRDTVGFRQERSKTYRLGYATSRDLKNWVRDDQALGIDRAPEYSGDWDSFMMCYPNIFRRGDDIYLLYNGNDFGRGGFGLAKLENKK